MAYYVCPNCNKANWIDREGGVFVEGDCKYCGYKGKFNLVILKSDSKKFDDLQ